jgi:hypothetical protein
MRASSTRVTLRTRTLTEGPRMRPDPSKPGYLEALTGECGLFMRVYALGGTCLLVFLIVVALFTL